MTELERVEAAPANELTLPHSGELINLDDETACATALDEVRRVQAHLADAVRTLSRALAARGAQLGTKTIRLSGGRSATISGDVERVYDAAEIEQGLRALGMPEEQIREVVVETVTYRVDANRAKRAAAANPQYKAVIDAATTEVEKAVSVSIRGRGRS